MSPSLETCDCPQLEAFGCQGELCPEKASCGQGRPHPSAGMRVPGCQQPWALTLPSPRAPHLERGPAAGAVAALQALEELRVARLVRADVEAQVLGGQEAGAADAAEEGPQQGLLGLVVVPVQGRAGVVWGTGVSGSWGPWPTSALLHLLAVFLA